MTPAVELELETPDQIAAGARSRAYHLLAAAISFPDESLAPALTSGEWLEEFRDVLESLPFGFAVPAEDLALLAGAPAPDALAHDYIRLFEVGTGRPFCPLYEGAHRGGRMKIMEELVRFYEHFGLKPATGDQPDHLCAELQFMHYLAFKQAAAPSADLLLAQRDFVYRHLAKWLPRLVDRLAEAREPSPYYSALTSVTAGFCRVDLEWLKECAETES